MQVACTASADGRIYRFYRSGTDLAQALKPLVPFLLASHADVIVGNEEGDALLLLRVGPISGAAEALLVSIIGPHITCGC
jgi:hypothetical protein